MAFKQTDTHGSCHQCLTDAGQSQQCEAATCTCPGQRQSQVDRKLGRLSQQVPDAVTQGWDVPPVQEWVACCCGYTVIPPALGCSTSTTAPLCALFPIVLLPSSHLSGSPPADGPDPDLARGPHTLRSCWAPCLLRRPASPTTNSLP